jgi:ankyrin repeat protein
VFIHAVVEGQTPRVLNFLRMGVDLDDTGSSDLTALHRAVLSGHEELLEPLIQYGADVNAISDDFGTPLCLAALKGMHEAASLLLKYKARPGTITKKTGTPLHCCVLNGGHHKATVVALISAGARLDTHATIDKQWLHAIYEWDGDDRNQIGLPLRSGACVLHHVTPAFAAVHAAQNDLLELLLPPDVNHFFRVEFKDATREIIQPPPPSFLVRNFQSGEEASNLTSLLYTYITICARNGDLDGVNFLIAKGAKLNFENEGVIPPLVSAAAKGHQEITTLLLDSGASVNRRDDEGCTALHNAARASFHHVVRVLCARGAAVDTKDNLGFTALHDAVAEGHHQAIQALCETGATVDAQSNDGRSPLWFAARFCAKQGDISCCEKPWHTFQMLIDAGADLNARDSQGLTPLLAMLRYNADVDCAVLRNLIRAGAYTRLRANDGASVLNLCWAKRYQFLEAFKSVCQALQSDRAVFDRVYSRLVSICEVHDKWSSGRWKRETILIYHLAEDGSEDLELILSIGADINAKGVRDGTALHRAARVDDCVAMDRLLIAGASLEPYDHKGRTPLAVAVRCNSIRAVQRLLVGGSNPHAKGPGSHAQSATELAFKTHDRTILKILARATEMSPSSDLRVTVGPIHLCDTTEHLTRLVDSRSVAPDDLRANGLRQAHGGVIIRADRTKYAVPEDGSPITIRMPNTARNQTSFLIEYFEANPDKPNSKGSVRVIPASEDAVGTEASSSFERQNLWTLKQVPNPNDARDLSGAPSPGLRSSLYTRVNSNVSTVAVLGDSVIESNPADSELARGKEPGERVASHERDDVEAPARNSSRSASRERFTRKVMEKLNQESEETSAASSNYGENKRRRRRSSKSQRSHGETSSAEPSPLPLSGSSIGAGRRSLSGRSRVTNNPKLLETVEDAIKRLILPEMYAIKEKQEGRSTGAASYANPVIVPPPRSRMTNDAKSPDMSEDAIERMILPDV